MPVSDDDLKAVKEALDHMDPEEARRFTEGLPELKDDADALAVVVRRRTKRMPSQEKGQKR